MLPLKGISFGLSIIILQFLYNTGPHSCAVWWRQLSPIHGTDVPTMEWRLSVHLNWFWGMFVWITLDNLSLAFLAHFSSPQNTGISSTPFERGTTQKWFLPQWLSERNTHPYKENTHWPKKKKNKALYILGIWNLWNYSLCTNPVKMSIVCLWQRKNVNNSNVSWTRFKEKKKSQQEKKLGTRTLIVQQRRARHLWAFLKTMLPCCTKGSWA